MTFQSVRIFGLLTITVGIISGWLSVMPAIIPVVGNRADTLATATGITIVNSKKPVITGEPKLITVERLGIAVEVVPGYYEKSSETWTLSKDKAQFATITAQPNDATGNTFIYGHNNQHVFGSLLNAQPGDTAIITTSNAHTFTYVLRSISDTDPRDISYLTSHDKPTLTIQTCSGSWYQYRRMLVFDLKEAS